MATAISNETVDTMLENPTGLSNALEEDNEIQILYEKIAPKLNKNITMAEPVQGSRNEGLQAFLGYRDENKRLKHKKSVPVPRKKVRLEIDVTEESGSTQDSDNDSISGELVQAENTGEENNSEQQLEKHEEKVEVISIDGRVVDPNTTLDELAIMIANRMVLDDLQSDDDSDITISFV